MNKTLFSVGIVGVLAAPAASLADTTLYGNIRWTVGQFDAGTSTVMAVNNASRVGLKGSIGEKGGITGIYHLQMGANADGNGNTGTGGGSTALTDRFYFGGIKGGFGTILYGRASSPYKMAGLKLDPFYDTSAGPLNGGSNYGFSSLTNGFFNNVLAYVSPKIGGGLTFNAVAVIDDGPTDDHAYNVGAAWSGNGITVGAQMISAEPAVFALDTAMRVHAGYKTAGWSAGISWENVDNGTVDGDFINVSGTFNVGPGKIAASYGTVDGSLTGARNAPGAGYSVGYFHKLAKKTEARLIYSSVDYDAGGPADRDVVGLMFIQSF